MPKCGSPIRFFDWRENRLRRWFSGQLMFHLLLWFYLSLDMRIKNIIDYYSLYSWSLQKLRSFRAKNLVEYIYSLVKLHQFEEKVSVLLLFNSEVDSLIYIFVLVVGSWSWFVFSFIFEERLPLGLRVDRLLKLH